MSEGDTAPPIALSYSVDLRQRNKMTATSEQVRQTLAELVDQHGESLAGLSRMLGRNEAYLQQFIRRGSPRRLPEDERLVLAQYFRVDERLLGARDPWQPDIQPSRRTPPQRDIARRRLNA